MSPPPAGAAATTGRHRPATRSAPRVPRRVSGPARPRAVSAAGGAVALPRPLGSPGWGRRALRRLAALADHPLLDRLLNGRAWIALVGFALIGIVFMQVSLLKLNAGIGRSVERAALLDRQNAELRGVVSELGSDDRLQQEAARLGLVTPPAGAVTFLGRNGKRIGGDGATALATGTATGPQPAGIGAGAVAPTPASASAAATAGAPAVGGQSAAAATGVAGGASGGAAGASGTAAPAGGTPAAGAASGGATGAGGPGSAPSGGTATGTTAGAPGAVATVPPAANRSTAPAGADHSTAPARATPAAATAQQP